MAKKSQSVSKKTQENYKQWLGKHSRSDTPDNKKHFKAMKEVRDAFNEARTGRQNNSYWAAKSEDVAGQDTESTSVGSNWEDRWTKQLKRWLGWYKPASTDDLRANYKSPSTQGRIESVLQKFQRLNIGWAALPNTKDDENAAEVMSLVLEHLFSKVNVKRAITAWAKDSLIHGSGFVRIYFLEKKRKLRFYRDEIDDDEYKKGKFWKEPEEVTIYSDVVIENVPIFDLYVDPQARCLHGDNYEARYVVQRKIMQIDEFKQLYGSNPLAKNVDMVKPASAYMDRTVNYDFFEPPKEIENKKSVEVLIYEDQLNDTYRVVANDIMVIDCPLPYNHKELSYHKLDCIPVAHQFYGIGIADRLMNSQGHEEVLFNMALDKVMQSLQWRFFADSRSFGELSQALLRAESAVVPVDVSDGNSINSKVMPFGYEPVGFDFYQMFELFNRNATLASQVDPSQMALLESGNTATATMVHKEQMELGIAAMVDNFSHGGLLSAGRQVAAIVRQKYTKPEIREIEEDGKKSEKEIWRSIRLEGMEVVMDEEKDRFVERESKDPYSYFEIRGEFLDTQEELDIRIKPESLEIMSKGLEMQKMQESFAQLVQFAVDPNNSMAMEQHPLPMINAINLFREYVEVMGFNEEILIHGEEDAEEQSKMALDHVNQILAGNDVKGTPGASPIHTKIEAKTLLDLQAEFDKAMEEVVTSLPTIGFDPMTGEPMLGEPSQEDQLRLGEMKMAIDRLTKHLLVEMMPDDMMEEAALEQSMPAPMEGNLPPEAQSAGMGGAMPPEMGGAGVPQPPMPASPTQQDVMGSGYGGAV